MIAGTNMKFLARTALMVVLTLLVVSVCVGSAAAEDNHFNPSDFYDGFNGWSQDSTGTSSSQIYGLNSAMGSYAESIIGSYSTTYAYAWISQDINLSNVDEITFQIALHSHSVDLIPTNNNVFGYIYIDNSAVSFTVDSGATSYENLNTINLFASGYSLDTYKTIHIDVSSYTGTHTFKVYYRIGSPDGSLYNLVLYSKNFKALDTRTLPVLNNASATLAENGNDVSNYMINTETMDNTSVNFSISFTAGNPSGTYVGYSLNNSQSTAAGHWVQALTSPYVYNVEPSDGLNTYYFWVMNTYGKSVNCAAFTIEKRSIGIEIDPDGYQSYNTTINFKTTGDTTVIDGSNSTWYTRIDTAGADWVPRGTGSSKQWTIDGNYLYDVKFVGQTTSGRSFTIESDDVINSKPSSVTWDDTEYTTSETARITWNVGNIYESGLTYTLYCKLTDSEDNHNPTSNTVLYTSSNLAVPEGYVDVPCSNFTYGYIIAYIICNETQETLYATSNPRIYSIGTLTIQVTNNNATWTTATTVTIKNQDNSQTIKETSNITSGSVTYNDIEFPAIYNISAVTEGYNCTTKYEMTTQNPDPLKLDFTNGASESTSSVGGSGSMYASTYVTMRLIDSGTGSYISNATVSAYAVSATNPVEWIANLLGSAWGGVVEGSTVSGTTDEWGKITFAMFPMYKYNLTITKGDKTFTYTFQPTELTTEEIIELPLTDGITQEEAAKLVVTSVDKDDSAGTITVSYADSSNDGVGTTEKVVVNIYSYEDGVKTLISGIGGTITGSQEFTRTWSLTDWRQKSFWVEFECYVGAFYTTTDHTEPSFTRDYGVTFSGVRIPIGNLPDGMYLVFSFAILVLLGAVGTQVTSRFYAIVVAGVGCFLLWAGWMGALGTVGTVACSVAFIIAILYYIAGGNQPQ